MKHLPNSKGSALLTTVIITAILAVIVASLLVYSMSEARLNVRNNARTEAKNAAEALLEYASAELMDRFERNINFTSSSLATAPLTVHSSRLGTLYATAATSPTRVDPSSAELYVSNITLPLDTYVDPRDPNNQYDPLAGQYVKTTTVRLLAKVNARVGTQVIPSYATEAIEVRNAGLFNYAIFYNIRLEFHPSPNMKVYGPVHSNSDVFLSEGSGLSLYGPFTTAGKFTAGSLSTTGRPAGRNIDFTNGADVNSDNVLDLKNIQNPVLSSGSLGTYVDSYLNSRSSSKTFYDVASELWAGYVQDSSFGVQKQSPPGALDPLNARKLIEPPDTSTSADASIEAQKFSRQSSLYMLVEPTGTVTVFRKTSSLAEDVVAYKALSNSGRATWRSSNSDKLLTPPTDMIKTDRAMKDFREDANVNMVDIDIGKLTTAVDELGTSTAASRFRKSDATNWNVSGEWNGGVYVEVENPNTGWNASLGIPGNGTRTAVRLINGGDLPQRRATATSDEGLTIATNAPIYVKGHFNADGSTPAGSETDYENRTRTSPRTHVEVPALIAADAVNILSPNWNDTKSDDSKSDRVAAPTEVSAAFISGVVETAANGSTYSGGVENYPRFHESWGSSNPLYYRGSIVALYASRYATGQWSRASYDPPARRWGYNKMFKEGVMPPLSPRSRTYRRVDYRDITQAEFESLVSGSSGFGFTRQN